MQKIMISVHPEWCEKIAPRLKTVEVRKNEPQCKLPFKCYIYETKGGAKKYYEVFHKNTVGKVIGEFVCDRIDAYVSELAEQSDGQIRFDHYTDAKGIHDVGTVICSSEAGPMTKTFCTTDLYKNSLVPYHALVKYIGTGTQVFYCWHISDLVIYDEPKELSAFSVEDVTAIKRCQFRERVHSNPLYTNGAMLLGSYICTKNAELDWCSKCLVKTLQRAPQSWCYVKGETNVFVSV